MLGFIAKRSGFIDSLRKAWKEDVRAAADPLRGDVKRLTHRIDRLTTQVQDLAHRLEAIEARERKAAERASSKEIRKVDPRTLLVELDRQQRDRIATLPALLNEERIVRHVRDAVASSPLVMDPFPHIVVERLLPEDLYETLLEAIPPPAFFSERDPIKQNLKVPMELGPTLTKTVFRFVDEVVTRKGIQPALLQKFDQPLVEHYDSIFGPEFRDPARRMPILVSGGRLMLRRPGYHLGPHRDPKRSIGTILLYFARPGDLEDYGTEIYRVFDDGEASYTQTYYPEQEGRRCELVKVVPFRPNTMLAFLNSHGAHGAMIPRSASPTLERYSCQFYLGPDGGALADLISKLPPERQARWQSKKEETAGQY